MSKTLGVIPARFQSSRFPGKPLALIAGKTLIQYTYENSRRSTVFDELIVATDDPRIYDHVQSFGGNVVMTSASCATGTDRLVEVLKKNPLYASYEIVINIQGDEPCVNPSLFTKLCAALEANPLAVMATAATPIRTSDEALNRHVVKCVVDVHGNALYFSRSLIPGGHQGTFNPVVSSYKHIGIYAFRQEFLLTYPDLPPTPLQQAEDLEQLRILEQGYRIKVIFVEEAHIGVDTPQDIRKVEELLCKQNTSLSPAASALH